MNIGAPLINAISIINVPNTLIGKFSAIISVKKLFENTKKRIKNKNLYESCL